MRSLRRYLLVPVVFAAWIIAGAAAPAMAQSAGEFSLQVSPSPLVATLKPGQVTTLELKVRNAGPATESLKIEPRTFRIENGEQLRINDEQEPEIAKWLTFAPRTFTVQSGQTATTKVSINVPKEAGFSYSFAMVISRAVDAPAQLGGQTIKASVGIFALLNVDRPGAVRSLEISRFASSKGSYEYVPVEFDVEFKNTGNTIVQPSGTLFIQRGSHDTTPIDTIDVNDVGSYVLPGMTRTLKMTWDSGFQVLKPKTDDAGNTTQELTWNWNRVGDMRFGQYTAKLIAVYDDGHRDIPLEAETKFWVFPWMITLIVVAVAGLIGFGLWSLISKIIGLGKRMKPKKKLRL